MVILVPPEHQSELGSVKCCSQLLLLHPSPVSSAVTPSYRRKTSQRLCACLCCSVCNRMYLHSFDETLHAKFVCCSNTFLMSRCHGVGSSVRGGVMATDYSLATLGPTPQLGVVSSWLSCRFALLCLYVCLCACWLRFARGRSSPPFGCLPPRSSSLCSGEELQSCDIWISPGTHSFSSLWPCIHLCCGIPWWNTKIYITVGVVSFDVCMWKEFSQQT